MRQTQRREITLPDIKNYFIAIAIIAKLHFLNNSSPKLAQSGAGRPFGSGCLVVEAHPSEPECIFSPMKLPASPSFGFL